jgi:hypothetical protein
MSKRDVLDERMARRFAWHIAKPGELPDVGEPAPALDLKPREGLRAKVMLEAREHGTATCAALARQVERAWEMTPGEPQVAATAKLFARAQALCIDLVAMQAHPLETVRLFRLIVRHYPRLITKGHEFDIYALNFAPLSLREREVVDLLVETAEAGDLSLAYVVEECLAGAAVGQRYPEIGERLTRVLDEGKTWVAREIAARWLSLGEFRDAIPSLQRALRLPHARVRWNALLVLLEMAPPALTEDDVLWLLSDAVAHPLPDGPSSSAYLTVRGYEAALIAAVKRLHPAEGWRPLAIIVDGSGAHLRKQQEGLSTGFALRALAAGYPKLSLARIDRALAQSRSYLRTDAVLAAALLPEELARPRLLDAAAGPESYAAECARQLWFERFGGECPSDPLAGVPIELLSAPPSEAFLARLVVVRGANAEATGALLGALLAEAKGSPSAEREALALLLFSLRDFGSAHRRPGLPSREEAWATRLIERFGEPAIDGLFGLAERGALAGVDLEWLGALASLARKGVLAGADRDRLRDLAARALVSPAWRGATAPLLALSAVGTPPELCDRLWSIAVQPQADDMPERRFVFTRHPAVEALCALTDTSALDERIVREAEVALRDRSYEELKQIVNLGCRRQLPAVFDLVERCLAGLDEDPALLDVAALGVSFLLTAGRLDEAWVLDTLSKPASLRFAITTYACRPPWASPEIIGALVRAFSSPARAGSAAAEAAEALSALDVLWVEESRLDGVLERAPERARASLMAMLVRCGEPLAPFRRHVVELLASADAKAAERVFNALTSKEPEETAELFEAALEMGPSPSVRKGIEHFLGEPSEAELYWCDADEEDEEEDQDEDLS